MSESPIQHFLGAWSPSHRAAEQEQTQLKYHDYFSDKHQELVVFPRRTRDSGIEESLPEPLLQPPRFDQVNETSDTIPAGCSAIPSPSSGSQDSNGSPPSNCSTDPQSNHEFSVYSSSDTAAEGGEGRKLVQAKAKDGAKGIRRKCSSKHHVVKEQVSKIGFSLVTPTYGYKWFIGLPSAYRLNGSKHLKVKEEAVLADHRLKKNIKLNLEAKILPNLTESSNERVAKMRLKLSVENAPLHEHNCTAITEISLHDQDTGERLLQKREERKIAGGMNYVQYFTTLGSQERIENYANKDLDIGVKVEFQFRSICSEDRDGYVYVK